MPQNHPTDAQIRARAYQLYTGRGCQPGKATDDWLQAEYELMQLPIAKIAELNSVRSSRNGARTSALIALVQTAVLLGTNAIAHVQR